MTGLQAPERAAPAASAPPSAPDPAVARTRAVLDLVFGTAAERAYDIHLWDGSVSRGEVVPRAPFTLRFTRRGALRRMLVPPSELSIAESLVSGDLEIDGELEKATGLADGIASRVNSLRGALSLVPKLLALPGDDERPDASTSAYARTRRRLARRSAASEIRFHYDVGNDFYALWLDESMVYTCAYFRSPTDSLHAAQVAKLDHICRKLRLRPGHRLLDIGCGWGALAMHAARHHGAEVLGITLSAAQAELAQRRIAEAGLSGRCRVEVMDFRDLPPAERFDRITSVGVTEHVPADQQEAYFRRAFEALVPGGLFLNHCETSNRTAQRTGSPLERLERWLWKRDQFIDRYVFPDARLVPFGSLVTKAEHVGFETRDVESLREHYPLTLRHWLAGLQAHRDEAIALVGERTYRVWRLYMSVAAHGFDSGALNLVQALFSRPTREGASGLPLTREDLYGGPRAG